MQPLSTLFSAVRQTNRLANRHAGTLLVLPPGYRVFQEQPLAAVAAETGLTVDTLLAANPGLDAATTLVTDTVLALPALYIVREALDLDAAADALGTPRETLLSANPAADEMLDPGEVLVVPPPQSSP